MPELIRAVLDGLTTDGLLGMAERHRRICLVCQPAQTIEAMCSIGRDIVELLEARQNAREDDAQTL